MKKIFILIMISYGVSMFGQRNTEEYFPKAPDAAAISKFIDIPPGSFTGTTSFEIPLYEIDFDGYKVPFSLTYHASGIKLAEIASRVGLGWALNLGGISLSGQIIGVKDARTRITFPENFNPDIYPEHELLAQELLNVNDQGTSLQATDIKPDIFSYSTLNSQGEFIMDSSGDFGIPRPFNQDKITQAGHKIIDTKGIEYNFTSNGLIKSLSTCSDALNAPYSYNFEPKQIKSTTGREINYFYEYANSKSVVNSNYFTSLTFNKQIQEIRIGPRDVGKFNPMTGDYEGSTEFTIFPVPDKCYNYNNHTEILLNRVEFPSGKIYFIYNDTDIEERKDLPKDYYLKQFIVVNNLGDTIKNYTFNYDYFTSDPLSSSREFEKGTNFRLKLQKVTNEIDTSNYVLSYYKEDMMLPNRMSSSYDYWGVYNGKDNTKATKDQNETSIPSTIFERFNSQDVRLFKGADRNPDFEFGIIGNLKEIKYPTGGSALITYEPDEFKIEPYVNPIYKYELKGDGINTHGDQTEKSIEFTIDHPSYEFKVFFYDEDESRTNLTEAQPGDCTLKMYEGDNYENLVIDLNTYQPKTWYKDYYNTFGPGKYKLVITSGVDQNTLENYHCIANVKWYEQLIIEDSDTRKAGTLRVAKIEKTDENQAKIIREFTYYNPNFPQNTSVGKTSGKNIGDQYFTSIAVSEFPKNLIGSYLKRLFLTNNPGWNLSTIGGKAIGYSNVQELYSTSQGKKYRKEYTFYNDSENTFNDIIPYNFIQFTFPGKDFNRGVLLEEKHYKEEGPIKKLVYKKIQDEPALNPYFNHVSSNYSPSNGLLLWGYEIYLRSISCIEQSNCIYEFNYAPFPITNYWVQPRYSYTEEFFDNQNSLLTESFTDYASNNPKHTFPISQRTTNSLGETLKTEYQYPLDLPNKPQAEKLISANRISEPLVVKSYNNGNLVSQQETVYGDFIGLTLPKFVYAKKGAYPEEKKISYDWYDNKGNLMQYTLENGTPVSIIWGYNGQYPIAKVEGATYSQISSQAQTLINLSNSGNLVKTSFDTLRNTENVMVTGYVYKPLIGVTSIIQPNGQIEYYEYDNAGRLEYIKDHNGKVIKRMEYHYKN